MKIALCFGSAAAASGHEEVVRRMLEAQRPADAPSPAIEHVGDGAIGFCRTSDRFSRLPLEYSGERANRLIVAGVPIDLNRKLEASISRVINDAQALVEYLQTVDGAFAAVLWDAEAQTLRLVTDVLGLQPLYVHRRDGLLLMASEIRGIAASGLVPVELDVDGWGAFIGAGNMLDGETMLRGVRRVEPAAFWTYDARTGAIESRRYWRWPDPVPSNQARALDTGTLLSLLDREYQAFLAHHPDPAMLLSGGGDSRFLLAMANRQRLRPRALIVDHPDELLNSDGRWGRALGREFCAGYTLATPGRDYFSSPEFLDYLLMTNISFPSLYLFIATVSAFLEGGAFWNGLLPASTIFPTARKRGSLAEYYDASYKKRDAPIWKAAFAVFRRGLAEAMYESVPARRAKFLDRYPDNDHGVSQYRFFGRTRNRTALNPMMVFANRALMFTPCISRDFWAATVSMPFAARADHALFARIFQRHFPEYLSVPICSRGRIVSSPGRTAFRERLFARAAALVERPPVKRVTNKLGITRSPWWEPSRLETAVPAVVELDHPDLDADGVRALQQSRPPSAVDAGARRLLVYWQTWRWLMEGDRQALDELRGGPSAVRAYGIKSHP